MNEIELKPCKSCGSRAAIKCADKKSFAITCTNVYCGIRTKWCLSIDEAVKIWNGNNPELLKGDTL